jgi:DNA-binding response OmpR family regulator
MARILLIDDDDAFRGMLRQAREREGYQVEEARDGLDISFAPYAAEGKAWSCSS